MILLFECGLHEREVVEESLDVHARERWWTNEAHFGDDVVVDGPPEHAALRRQGGSGVLPLLQGTRVNRDATTTTRESPDGEATFALPFLCGADVDAEIGRDLLPTRQLFGGVRHSQHEKLPQEA